MIAVSEELFADVGRGVSLCYQTYGDPAGDPLLLIMGMSCLAALIPAAPANIGALQFALVEAFMFLRLPDPDLGGNSLALLTQGCFVMSCILVGGALYVRATLVAVRRRTG